MNRLQALCAVLLAMCALSATVCGAESSAANAAIHSKAAAKAGKATYLRLCQYCHGFDGKALENIDFQATNLTDLSVWKHGVEPENIFNSIKNGAGEDMLSFKSKLSDDEIWQLVAFILSIGPEERRPQND